MKKRILIVVDMQNDFITGALGSAMAQAIVPNVKAKIDEYERNGDIIWYTRDTHYENYLQTQEGRKLPVEHCIQGTWGWEIADGLYRPNAKVINIVDKLNFGSLHLADLIYQEVQDLAAEDYEVEEIEFVGLCTDICVVSNVLIFKAKLPEITITVDGACCAGVTEKSHQAALLVMQMCQANILNWEDKLCLS